MTLIELMVVVAIVAILGAIAVPAYQNYVREARRSTAQGQMVELQSVLERFFSDNNTYVGFPFTDYPGGDQPADMFPDHLPRDAPHDSATYGLSLVLGAATYTITATPVAAQAGDGVMTLTSAGAKTWDEDNDGAIDAGESDWHD